MIIHPLAMVIVYTLILSQIMTAKLPGVATQYAYPIYILSGIIGWTFFSEIFNRSLNVFIDNANLIKKMSFPKLALPIIIIGTALLNFMIFIFITFLVLAFLGHFPYHALYWLPLLVFLTLLLAISMGLFFGILNIFIRDIGQLMSVLLQFWFWFTPIVYMISIVPEKYHKFFMINPLNGIIMGYQNILLYDKAPDFDLLIYPSFIILLFSILTAFIYKKANKEMADVL